MNQRTIALQALVFLVQWALMLVGFGLLDLEVAGTSLVPPSIPFGRIVDAGVKGLIALALSVVWLYVWDRQVRFLFYRGERR